MSSPGLPILSVCMVSKVKQLGYVLVSNIDEIFEIDSMLAKFSRQSDCRWTGLQLYATEYWLSDWS